mmetsp:Transcript_96425/g.272665  ORF Transcript_96425/g.272665 Transcript_96425/m.272665 type:complete len:458 (+) Transcript_96425:53-1426(+)
MARALSVDTGQAVPCSLSFADGAAPSAREVGVMTFQSAVLNLTNTILGSGALTMPFIFAQLGWLPANLVAIVVLLLTTFSVYLLSMASDRAKRLSGGNSTKSFESLGYWCCGTFGSLYAEVTFIVGGIGTLTSYLIFIEGLEAQVLGVSGRLAYLPLVISVALVILPLSSLRQIHALRYASIAAVFAIIYISVMYYCFDLYIGKYDDDPSGKYKYEGVRVVTWTSRSVRSMNLTIGAFCVQNTCLPVYGELADRSPRKMVGATLCAMLISVAIYECIGLSGYALLGARVTGNSLLVFDNNFVKAHPWTQFYRDIAKVSVALLLAFSVPLAIWPCRSAVCSVIRRAQDGCAGPARGVDGASAGLFRGITALILTLVTCLAIVVPDVTVPLSLVNSLAGGSMIFIMPGLFFLGSVDDRAQRYSLANWHIFAMIGLGVFCSSLGFWLEVRSIIWGQLSAA